jgi:hypothetical protein
MSASNRTVMDEATLTDTAQHQSFDDKSIDEM